MNINPNEGSTNFTKSQKQEEETMSIRQRFVGFNRQDSMNTDIDADPTIEICLSSDSGLSIHTWWDDCGERVDLGEDIDLPSLPNISELIILLTEVREYASRNFPEQYKKHISQIF